MRSVRKIFNYSMLILTPILLMRIFVFGDMSFNHYKGEFIALMLIGVYYLISGIFYKYRSKPSSQKT